MSSILFKMKYTSLILIVISRLLLLARCQFSGISPPQFSQPQQSQFQQPQSQNPTVQQPGLSLPGFQQQPVQPPPVQQTSSQQQPVQQQPVQMGSGTPIVQPALPSQANTPSAQAIPSSMPPQLSASTIPSAQTTQLGIPPQLVQQPQNPQPSALNIPNLSSASNPNNPMASYPWPWPFAAGGGSIPTTTSNYPQNMFESMSSIVETAIDTGVHDVMDGFRIVPNAFFQAMASLFNSSPRSQLTI
ncbi:DNA translocase FtsK-like [Sitodiplosis mosellana]|uniref:DNA translocase FtsK-like n=1 Tax=Sitodiplosis mosellana TaxID=263140 RepID=UPI002444489E|nr:DNA translocase FtsK-like [Sitodiplosis mosellana]